MQELTRNIEKYATDYLNKNYDFEKVLVKYRRKKVLEILEHYKPKNILEIGCGCDSISNYYTDFEKFVVVEPSEKFAQKAIKNKNVNLYIDFFENKLNELKDQNFDFIILSSLLHEVVNPNEFMQKVISICKKKTILHINVPNSKSFHLLWAYEAGLIEKLGVLTKSAIHFQQHTAFSLESLQNLVLHYNLKILDKGSYFIKPFDYEKMQKLTELNIIDENLLEGLYKINDYMPEFGAEIYLNCKIK